MVVQEEEEVVVVEAEEEAEATIITPEVRWLLPLKAHCCNLNTLCRFRLCAPRTICCRLTSSSINYSKQSTRTKTKRPLPVSLNPVLTMFLQV